MARDIFHNHVKEALIKDGWLITEDPFLLKTKFISYEIDLAAEKLIAATRANEEILVEIKSFLRQSKAYEMHAALGQFQTYLLGIQELGINKQLFLAIPEAVYDDFFQQPFIQKLIAHYQVNLIVFNPIKKEIVQWIE
ncbi:MAG: element excision factor XisH family protein [Saprospiraceae bacterium]